MVKIWLCTARILHSINILCVKASTVMSHSGKEMNAAQSSRTTPQRVPQLKSVTIPAALHHQFEKDSRANIKRIYRERESRKYTHPSRRLCVQERRGYIYNAAGERCGAHWECQYEQERERERERKRVCFFFLLRSHVICLFHPFLFASRVSFPSARLTWL